MIMEKMSTCLVGGARAEETRRPVLGAGDRATRRAVLVAGAPSWAQATAAAPGPRAVLGAGDSPTKATVQQKRTTRLVSSAVLGLWSVHVPPPRAGIPRAGAPRAGRWSVHVAPPVPPPRAAGAWGRSCGLCPRKRLTGAAQAGSGSSTVGLLARAALPPCRLASLPPCRLASPQLSSSSLVLMGLDFSPWSGFRL